MVKTLLLMGFTCIATLVTLLAAFRRQPALAHWRKLKVFYATQRRRFDEETTNAISIEPRDQGSAIFAFSVAIPVTGLLKFKPPGLFRPQLQRLRRPQLQRLLRHRLPRMHRPRRQELYRSIGKANWGFMPNAYGPLAVAGIAAYAGFLQEINSPAEWGQGGGAYGKRFASTLGWSGIHGVLAFGLDSTLHQDPRYYRSLSTGFWRRSAHALRGTFLTRTDSGGETVSIWRIGSAYGAAFLSNLWYPARLDTPR